MGATLASFLQWLHKGQRLDQHLRRETNNFNLIRLAAAVMIILSHCNAGLIGQLTDNTFGGRTTAMPVFFFLSGLLVAQSLDNSPSALSFLARRARRLYPAAIFYVLIMACIIGPFVSSYSTSAYFADPLFRQYLFTASLVQIHFLLPGVFSASPLGPVVNTSLWSIPMEIKLYLLLLLTSYLPKRRLTAFYLLLTATLVAVDLFAYAPVEEAIRHHGLPHFVLFPYTQLPICFLIGVLCYRLRTRILVRNSWLFIICLGYIATNRYQIGFILIPMTVLYFATHGMRFLHRLTPRPDLSYGLYIWGFPVQQLIILYGKPTNTTLFPLTLLLTIPIALLSWYIIEKPALRWKRRPTWPIQTQKGRPDGQPIKNYIGPNRRENDYRRGND